MGRRIRFQIGSDRHGRSLGAGPGAVVAAAVVATALGSCLAACSGQDDTHLSLPEIDGSSGRVEAFLGLPQTAAESAEGPALLSQTLAFGDLDALQVSPGILPYSVQTPLWSDGAHKLRWMALPTGSKIGFSTTSAWSFPVGSVFIKHFGMALDERSPEDVTRLETRFLVAARDGGYYGLVYKWDEDQRDARLLLGGEDEVLQIVQADGSVREQHYTYPSQQACNACHSDGSGYVMGVRTGQLNGEHDYGANGEGSGAFNQLATWSSLGVFDTAVGDRPLDEYQRLAPLTDESAPLETRVRSYWEANCSSCHNPGSPIESWDAHFSTPFEQEGVLLAEPRTGPRPDGVRLITPGDPQRSLIYLRSASVEPGLRMPPMLKNRVDERYVALLGEWITSLGRHGGGR
jgi:uncharacterized repeat protein (TIGR03806 family)